MLIHSFIICVCVFDLQHSVPINDINFNDIIILPSVMFVLCMHSFCLFLWFCVHCMILLYGTIWRIK